MLHIGILFTFKRQLTQILVKVTLEQMILYDAVLLKFCLSMFFGLFSCYRTCRLQYFITTSRQDGINLFGPVLHCHRDVVALSHSLCQFQYTIYQLSMSIVNTLEL